jgi:chromosome segregation ATPase
MALPPLQADFGTNMELEIDEGFGPSEVQRELEEQIDALNNKVLQLQGVLDSKSQENNHLASALGVSFENAEQRRAELQLAKETIQTMVESQGRMESLEKDLESKNRELGEQRSMIANKENELTVLRAQVDEHRADLSQSLQILTSIRHQFNVDPSAEETGPVSMQRIQQEQLDQKVIQLRNSVKSVETKLEEVESSLKGYLSAEQVLKRDMAQLQGCNRALELELERCGDESAAALKAVMSSARERQTVLEAEIQKLEIEATNAKSQHRKALTVLGDQNTSVMEKTKVLEADLRRSISSAEQAELGLKNLSDKFQKSQEQLRRREGEWQRQESVLKKIQNGERQALEHELSVHKLEVARLRRDAGEERESCKLRLEKLEAKISDQERELSASGKKIKSLSEVSTQLRAAIQDNNVASKERQDALKKQQSKIEADLQKTREELERTKKELKVLESAKSNSGGSMAKGMMVSSNSQDDKKSFRSSFSSVATRLKSSPHPDVVRVQEELRAAKQKLEDSEMSRNAANSRFRAAETQFESAVSRFKESTQANRVAIQEAGRMSSKNLRVAKQLASELHQAESELRSCPSPQGQEYFFILVDGSFTMVGSNFNNAKRILGDIITDILKSFSNSKVCIICHGGGLSIRQELAPVNTAMRYALNGYTHEGAEDWGKAMGKSREILATDITEAGSDCGRALVQLMLIGDGGTEYGFKSQLSQYLGFVTNVFLTQESPGTYLKIVANATGGSFVDYMSGVEGGRLAVSSRAPISAENAQRTPEQILEAAKARCNEDE